jgi:chemotaxis protein CheZ
METDRDADFLAALDNMVNLRRRELFAHLRALTQKLQTALDRFDRESRFAQLAEREVPDARARLTHVLTITDNAAHRTMDLVDQSVPLAERAGEGAAALAQRLTTWIENGSLRETLPPLLELVRDYLATTVTAASELKRNLNEVVVAQTFQDLTGQIIRSVIALVLELETTLGELIDIAGSADAGTPARAARPRAAGHPTGGAFGPVIPGVTEGPVVAAQAEVDDLLSGLGI